MSIKRKNFLAMKANENNKFKLTSSSIVGKHLPAFLPAIPANHWGSSQLDVLEPFSSNDLRLIVID
jgi:hypothetical protein